MDLNSTHTGRRFDPPADLALSQSKGEEPAGIGAELSRRERALWREVLIVAISDLSTIPAHSDPSERRLLKGKCVEWISAADERSVGSFNWVCAVLDLDARAVRRKLLTSSPERLKHRLRLYHGSDKILLTQPRDLLGFLFPTTDNPDIPCGKNATRVSLAAAINRPLRSLQIRPRHPSP